METIIDDMKEKENRALITQKINGLITSMTGKYYLESLPFKIEPYTESSTLQTNHICVKIRNESYLGSFRSSGGFSPRRKHLSNASYKNPTKF